MEILFWWFYKIVSLVFYLFPIKPNKIVVYNFGGLGYGENPKHLIEEILKIKDCDVYWIVAKRKTPMPKGIKKVKLRSLRSLYHLITARLWLDTIRNSPRPYFKRKNQYYLQMWHGGLCIKGIEGDVEEFLSKRYVKTAKQDGKFADLMLSSSREQTETIKRAFWFNGKILEYGIPRDDVLLNPPQSEIEKLKEKYNLQDKKIALYAPTFRNDVSFYDTLEFDVQKLKTALESTFGGEFALCYRIHPNNANNFKHKFDGGGIIDLSKEPDSQIVLTAMDVVISDYSGMWLNALVTKKKTFFYAPDYESYVKRERKLYFDVKETGLPFSETFDELIGLIKNFNPKEYEQKLTKFFETRGFFQKPNSSELVAKYLFDNKILTK